MIGAPQKVENVVRCLALVRDRGGANDRARGARGPDGSVIIHGCLVPYAMSRSISLVVQV